MSHVEKFKEKVEELVDLFERKNKNYGDSVFGDPVLAPWVDASDAILVRMSDKIKRCQTLVRGEPDLVGESLRDTLTDLAVYIIIWLSLTEGLECE